MFLIFASSISKYCPCNFQNFEYSRAFWGVGEIGIGIEESIPIIDSSIFRNRRISRNRGIYSHRALPIPTTVLRKHAHLAISGTIRFSDYFQMAYLVPFLIKTNEKFSVKCPWGHSNRKCFQKVNNYFGQLFKNFPGRFYCKLLSFVRLIPLFINSEFYILIKYVMCILDCFILNYKLWDKFLSFMIFIISYISIFYRNVEIIFQFMTLKRATTSSWNVWLPFIRFLYLPLIIFK